jgi:hypothetical protein
LKISIFDVFPSISDLPAGSADCKASASLAKPKQN